MSDSYVQISPDGSGKKVSTQQFIRSDGATVEAEQVLASDPKTGLPLDAPPWETIIVLQRAVLAELRVLTSLIADEFRATGRELDELRSHYEDEIQ